MVEIVKKKLFQKRNNNRDPTVVIDAGQTT
jgi:hypothetical protein